MKTPGQDRNGSQQRRARPQLRGASRAGRSSRDAALEPNSIVTRSATFIEPAERLAMIAEAAYYRAQGRGFDPGHDIDDWLAAEADIDATLARGDVPTACGD